MQVESYLNVEILPDAVIYCDIPYRGTEKYRYDKFNHEEFYDWALRQTQPVFISEYAMPEEFVSIAEFRRVSTFSATNNSKVETEKIFIPKAQKDMIETLMHPSPRN